MRKNAHLPVTLLCPQCGQEFTRPYKLRDAKFCGHRCAMLFHQAKVFAASQTAAAIEKNAAARRGRGDGKSYPKLNGRHAHRIVGERIAGRPLGPNEVVHHKDENRLNYREGNLEVLSRSEHTRLHSLTRVRVRPTHCKHGHELTPENVYTYPDGRRRCLTCQRAYDNAWKKAKRASNSQHTVTP